jgi:hypothetical protein
MPDEHLRHWIVTNEATAERIADVSRLVPQTLLEHDIRIQRLFTFWWETCGVEDLPHRIQLVKTWARKSPTPGAVLQDPDLVSLYGELDGMRQVLQVLGLGQYRWLPVDLWWAFVAQASGARVKVSIPGGLAWEDGAGRRPKQPGPKAATGSRVEDLERDVLWWYLCTIKVPPRKRLALAREHGTVKSNVDRAIARVRHLMNAIK